MKKLMGLVLSVTMAMGFATSAMANTTTQSIGIGYGNVALVTEGGQLVMWGGNEYGDFGNGTTAINPMDFTKSTTDVVSVACGLYYSTAIIKSDGTLWTCGRNNSGQLGNGTKEDSSTFIKIDSNVVKVCGGHDFFIYLKKDGTLWGMGNSSEERLLKDFDGEDVKTPTKLMEGVKDFSTYNRNTAVITMNNDLYTFGANIHGQLGIGKITGSPEEVELPVKVLSDVKSVSVGSEYMMAVKNDNTLWTWGTNTYGELMSGKSGDEVCTPTKVADNVLKACASSHNSAYITTNNELYMAGENLNGQLGFQEQWIEIPRKIADNVKDVATAKCTVYTTLDGKTYTTGDNINEMGRESKEIKEQPYKISDEYKYTVDAKYTQPSTESGNTITLQIGSNILTNNGKDTTIDVPAQIINGRTMVPLRAIFEALGADVQWNGETKTISSSKGTTNVSLQINSTELKKNSETKTIDVPAQLVDSRTLVPVRAIAEAYDCTVGWDSDTKTVSVNY